MNGYATCWSVKVGVGARPPAEVGPEVPLTLREAAVLPELGGRFSAKQLRTAIGSGALAAEDHGGTLYVTRAGLRDWREASRVKPVRHVRETDADTQTALLAARESVRRLRGS
ncbi:hypothetical protein [Aureimonas sp. AU40]|uniref:hypothetical protein n=1 Tax=Aureimonas sp. AU40 TaxID=1637747 RepID=UPI000781CEFE|nr:hypothetical protein [Aureimonas sp. AU40]